MTDRQEAVLRKLATALEESRARHDKAVRIAQATIIENTRLRDGIERVLDNVEANTWDNLSFETIALLSAIIHPEANRNGELLPFEDEPAPVDPIQYRNGIAFCRFCGRSLKTCECVHKGK